MTEIDIVKLGELLEKKQVKFVGFISEDRIKDLKSNHLYIKTNSSDLVSEVFGQPKRNVYVYQKVRS